MSMAAVQLLRKKSRTRLELASLLGCSPTQVTRYLKAMHEEGLARRTRPDWHGKQGGTPDEWEWINED
jgi:predicted ArsR family transcriptional regulator